MVIFLRNSILNKISEIFEDRTKSFKFMFISNSEDDTLNLGYTFANYLKKGDVITLNGELGSGKTVFVKGVGKFFNIQNEISSPTFTIVNEYNTEYLNIYHFDVYRISDVYNFEETVGTDYFSNGICLIEWGEMLDEILPINTIHIDFKKNDDNLRSITIWRS